MMPIKALRMRNATALWTPASLSVAPKIWLNDDSTVTDAGGGACSQWNDISGNGYHFTQATSSARPDIVAGELNGRRVIRFDGTTDYQQNNSSGVADLFRNTGYGWMIATVKKRSVDVSAVFRSVFYSPTGTAADASRFFAVVGSTADANKPQLRGRRLDADGTASLSATADTDTSWHMRMYRFAWADGDGFIDTDGASDTQNLSLVVAGNTSNTAAAHAAILGAGVTAGPVPANFADIDLAEIMIGSGSMPSATEIDKLFGYLAHRWGLAGSLPGGHPYKTAPPTV